MKCFNELEARTLDFIALHGSRGLLRVWGDERLPVAFGGNIRVLSFGLLGSLRENNFLCGKGASVCELLLVLLNIMLKPTKLLEHSLVNEGADGLAECTHCKEADRARGLEHILYGLGIVSLLLSLVSARNQQCT